jgi:putative transposase
MPATNDSHVRSVGIGSLSRWLEALPDHPQHDIPIYCDNGTEFVSAAMDLWAYNHGVILDFSRRGKPTDNAMIESFNGRFREDCLNAHWFASLEDAQQKVDAFRWDYNEHHPHRSLKGQSPREFAKRMLATAVGSLS